MKGENTMTRNEIVEKVCEWYGIDTDDLEKKENGEYDLNSYTFEAGCSLRSGGAWLNLGSVVRLIEKEFNC